MKRLLGAGLALLLMAQAPAPAGVEAVGWLAGRWATQDGERWTEEMWSAPRGGLMLGASRAGRGDAVREFEFLRLQAGADGVLAYIAQPGGGPAVSFPLAAREGTSITFENPAHDFPQRIRYVRDGDSLTATISKMDGSNAMSWTFRRQ
ncbi:MAG TPA: DUF6265 family protein [Allosphingosinicella sp.]|nr:DUF6265 family protein [Allosphingosinicella sp.]